MSPSDDKFAAAKSTAYGFSLSVHTAHVASLELCCPLRLEGTLSIRIIATVMTCSQLINIAIAIAIVHVACMMYI